MSKLVTLTKIVSAILVIGTIGSLDIDRIDLWTAFCQEMLGITLWLLSNYWEQDLKALENEKVR